MTELRVRLTGEGAELGKVPAADVAQLILLIERAAAQAAAVVLGRPKITTGRYQGVVEQAVHFRLLGVEEGSVVPVLELPDAPPVDDGAFELEVTTLGQAALETLLDTAGGDKEPHPIVAKALLELADKLHVGERYDEITFIATPNRRPARTVRIDRDVRQRLRSHVERAAVVATRPDDLMGVLVEADFEKRTARLRTPTKAGVEVAFSDEQADDIQAALRQRSTVRGDVVYDPKSHTAKTIRLTELVRGEQMILGVDPAEFWSELSFEELARRQGAGRPVHPNELYDVDASDQERDAFMAAIAEFD